MFGYQFKSEEKKPKNTVDNICSWGLLKNTIAATAAVLITATAIIIIIIIYVKTLW